MARLVIVSNRVPAIGERGQQTGGLAVALEDALKREALWLGWSGRIAQTTSEKPSITLKNRITLATIDLGEEDYQRFYVGFSNSILWPLLHYRLSLVEYVRADYRGYRDVNRRYAAALSPLLKPDDIVWVHDYHLIPLATELRLLGHGNRIGFFLHIPFPPAGVFKALPCASELLGDLCAYDVSGFQTPEDRGNFLDGVTQLTNAVVRNGTIQTAQNQCKAVAIPVGIDPERFAHLAERSARSEYTHRLKESLAGRQLIIGADRLDYSKGLINRFAAYAQLLEGFQEHRLKVSYLQVTPRSRKDVHDYQTLKRNLDRLAGKINGNFAEFDWIPLRYMTKALPRSTLSGFYRHAAVGLVTPFRDGMNLVAKEYVAAQDPENPGVLVLSRFAGAAATLTDALLVNPHDPEEIAEAMHRALVMPVDERKARWTSLNAKVRTDTAAAWSQRFVAELREERPSRPRLMPAVVPELIAQARPATLIPNA